MLSMFFVIPTKVGIFIKVNLIKDSGFRRNDRYARMAEMKNAFEPKLVTVLKEGYTFKLFAQDLWAGIIVGIVALPLSIAFAIASGVKPEQGLITAVIGGFLISAFSGSRVQIGGPTGAFIVIVYGIVQKYGYEGLALATIMAGVMLIVMGLARMGDVIKFIPFPVTIGFTSGIAVIIFTSQVPDFLGLHLEHTPEKFLAKWSAYAHHLTAVDPYALATALMTVLIILFWRKVTDRLPGPLMAIIATTALAHIFHWPLQTIGTRFGSVPHSIPMPHIPHLDLDMIIKMSPSALTIALLAGIESLLSAVVADGMTGRRHRSNMELIGQGLANLASPLFNGLPATGAIARTATNIKNGGQTPIAGIIHALTVLILFMFLGQWAALIPMATLAGILVVVAYNMGEWSMFVKLFRSPKSDIMVLLTTFLLTVLVDLTVAIEVGIVLAAFLFMKRMIEVTQVNYLAQGSESNEWVIDPTMKDAINLPTGIEIFEINGPFFFGAADKFRDTLNQMKRRPKVLILQMRFVPAMDATGLSVLEDLLRKSKKGKIDVVFSGVHAQPLKVMKEAGIIEMLGQEHFHADIKTAIIFAQQLVSGDYRRP
jgi:sulfate permease, SulP family